MSSYARRSARTSDPIQVARSGHILVVDDESLIRFVVTQMLAHAGYQIDTAKDGQAGWEALQGKSYDLLITDYNMPKFSGLELVRRLRANGQDLPVILISGAMPVEELNRFPWLRLAARLSKPFTGEELLRTVNRVLADPHDQSPRGATGKSIPQSLAYRAR